MFNKIIIASAFSGLFVLATANVYAAQVTTEQVIAREASEAPRGADNNNQRRRGRNGASEDVGSFVIAREASEAPRGADNNNQRRRGRG